MVPVVLEASVRVTASAALAERGHVASRGPWRREWLRRTVSWTRLSFRPSIRHHAMRRAVIVNLYT